MIACVFAILLAAIAYKTRDFLISRLTVDNNFKSRVSFAKLLIVGMALAVAIDFLLITATWIIGQGLLVQFSWSDITPEQILDCVGVLLIETLCFVPVVLAIGALRQMTIGSGPGDSTGPTNLKPTQHN